MSKGVENKYREITSNCTFLLEDGFYYYVPKKDAPKWVKGIFEGCSEITQYYLFHCANCLAGNYEIEDYLTTSVREICLWARKMKNSTIGGYLKYSILHNPECDDVSVLLHKAFMAYIQNCIYRIEFFANHDSEEVECI